MGVGDSHIFVIPPARNKCKRKEGDSEEEDDEEDDSEDQGDEEEEDEEESVGKKGKKAELCDEEVSDGVRLLPEPAAGPVLVRWSAGHMLMRHFHLG